MKSLKILAYLLVGYVAIVVVFESLLGYFQPAGQGTIVVTTTDDDGAAHSRVVARMESDGKLYVAANHWPRAWFRQALERPDVSVTVDGETRAYLAVSVDGAEHERVDAAGPLGFGFRVLTGFPPRYFLRLDPK
ncbi:MAG: pyridoxamine 5'-phosphate oxidase family protein [Pseudomonadales bacterium]|jgi:hypothetical protein|nr:pyridoxamine 5'-phosphate oxidase family protein [Pseudomonadales bacterium]MDP6470532.1 pyridoxamine 5'-phosphate oxidase family protein [Pseudomonadales bacterium]MDP6827834.1 pyridoxamine 5'-phosphate oxidase family protein [Pseudomonadales bacterium]MDP6972166.1 pyridoxamine 5'-phosphate oxidase family protein [Pseudomonadales bacterium]|tara:strand:- start:271 stop:672 length:402 start_codon:yes stop_codon:yes gene_type:complete